MQERQLEQVWFRGVLDSRQRNIAFLLGAAKFLPVEYTLKSGIPNPSERDCDATYFSASK
ncbi:hypothetical protein [Paracoccus sp. T5]